MQKAFLFMIVGILTAIPAHAGQIQLSTYYPSPFGYYERLKFNPRTSLTEPCEPGTVYYLAGTGLRYCAEDTLWKSIGAGVWTQSGDTIYPADTATNPNLNIGIGTTGPSAKLEILTTAAADPVFKMGSTGVSDYQSLMLYNGSGNTSLFVAGTANNFIPGTTAGDGGYRVAVGKKMFFGNTGAAFMTLLSNGNVGIGTTSPLGDIGLHLKTPQWRYSPAAGMIIQAATAGDSPGLMLFDSNNYDKGAFGLASLVQNWSYDALADDVVLRSSNGRLIFSTESIAASPPYPAPPRFRARMLIDQNGNVGIGTTAPGSLLHVSGNSYPNIQIENSSITGDAYFRVKNTGGIMGDFMLNGVNETTFGGPNSLNIINNTANPITFYNNGQERIRVDGFGNVGIGTTAPTANLEVAGQIKATGGTLIYQCPNGDPDWQRNQCVGQLTTNAQCLFVDGGGEYTANCAVAGRMVAP